jgi:hypothetical protein
MEKWTPLLLSPLHLHPSSTLKNENAIVINHKCLMAKATKVTTSPTPSPSHSKSISMDNVSSLKIKKELVSCDEFIATMKGQTKVYFETLMCQLGDARDTDMSQTSIIFEAPCLFLHHLLSVLLHFVAFLCIFWN